MLKQPRFQKKKKQLQVFLKYTMFFIVRTNHIFLKVHQKKGNVAADTFLDIAEVFLTLKLSAWNRSSTTSVEL